MRSLIVALFCIGVFTSCISEKKRNEICRTCQHSDSVSVVKHDTVIMRDTTVYFTFLGDTISTPCPTHDTVIIKKNGGIVTKVIYKDKTVQCICQDDSLKLVIAKINSKYYSEIDRLKFEKIPELSPCIDTWWQTLYKYGFWTLLPLVIAYCGYRGVKFIGWLAKKMP